MRSIIVSDIESEVIIPKVDNPAFKKYLPSVLFPEKMSFVVTGVSNAVSNGLRRTMGGEMIITAMMAKYEDFETTDPHHIREMIIKRLRMIPVDQSVPLNAEFSLKAENTTGVIRDVKSSEIKIGKNKPVFNETFTICTLAPGKYMKISPITMHQAYGCNRGDGMHVAAVNTTSIALDQTPLNLYESTGISCSVSNPRKWKIGFTTTGTIPGKKLVKMACQSIIDRVGEVKTMLDQIENVRDEYILVIDGETHTIGNLLMRTVLDIYPDVDIVFEVASDFRSVTMKMRTDDDAAGIYRDAIKKIIEIYETISKQF